MGVGVDVLSLREWSRQVWVSVTAIAISSFIFLSRLSVS